MSHRLHGVIVTGSPKNIRELVAMLPKAEPVDHDPFVIRPTFNIFGMPIIADSRLPDEVPTGRALFPDDRFVEYEQSDAKWALSLGLAEPEMEPVVYVFDRAKHRLETKMIHGIQFSSPTEGFMVRDFRVFRR